MAVHNCVLWIWVQTSHGYALNVSSDHTLVCFSLDNKNQCSLNLSLGCTKCALNLKFTILNGIAVMWLYTFQTRMLKRYVIYRLLTLFVVFLFWTFIQLFYIFNTSYVTILPANIHCHTTFINLREKLTAKMPVEIQQKHIKPNQEYHWASASCLKS